MKCQTLFSGKNKKNINLSSAENAQRVVKVNMGDAALLVPISLFFVSLHISAPAFILYEVCKL